MEVDLTDEEAKVLENFGKDLAADSSFKVFDDDLPEDNDDYEPSIIDVRKSPNDNFWNVRVKNAVGAIRLGDKQLIIQPKISLSHFSYIASLAITGGNLRMLRNNLVNLSSGTSYFEAMANAYLDLLEDVLKLELVVEYESFEDTLTYARGKIHPVRTAKNFLKGAPRFDCKFEEFSVDNPVNRILKAAASQIARSRLCQNREIQRRSSQMAFRIDGVGQMRPSDLHAKVGRISARHKSALKIAMEIIGGNLRILKEGNLQVSSFLQYTPGIIEQGIRQVLSKGLESWASVVKEREYAVDGNMSFNPDLVFIDKGIAISVDQGPADFGTKIATGDIKYKRDSKWGKQTLNQAVTFAESMAVDTGIVVSFRGIHDEQLPSQKLKGGITIHSSTWVDDENMSPIDAAADLCRSVAKNLGRPEPSLPKELVLQ